jgi:hypothetical protein
MEPSMVAIVMLSVVLDSAIHRYLSGCPPVAGTCVGSRRDITPTLHQPTPRRLLVGNYLSGSHALVGGAGTSSQFRQIRGKLPIIITNVTTENAFMKGPELTDIGVPQHRELRKQFQAHPAKCGDTDDGYYAE